MALIKCMRQSEKVHIRDRAFLCLFILSLLYFAWRHKRGEWVPDWVKPLVIT